MATPCTAATTGLADASRVLITSPSAGDAVAAGVLNSLISAPLENTLPPPVMTMALTAASALAASTPSRTAVRLAWLMVFMGGLFMVITATSPCRVYLLMGFLSFDSITLKPLVGAALGPFSLYTSSHSLRTASFPLRSAGVPSNTIWPCPIT